MILSKVPELSTKHTEIGNFSSFFALPPLKTQKSKFWKMKIFAGDIIISHMCTKNHNHMMYSFWDMERDRQNFLSFWAIFLPFYSPHPNDLESQNFEEKKEKNAWRYYPYTYMYTINQDHMTYGSWNIRCDKQKFVFLGHFLPFQPLDNLENQNFNLTKKRILEILSFYTHVP